MQHCNFILMHQVNIFHKVSFIPTVGQCHFIITEPQHKNMHAWDNEITSYDFHHTEVTWAVRLQQRQNKPLAGIWKWFKGISDWWRTSRMKTTWDNFESFHLWTFRQRVVGGRMGEGGESREREGWVELRGDLSSIGPNNQGNVKVNHSHSSINVQCRQWILVGRGTREGGSRLLQNLIRKQVRNSSIRKRTLKSAPAVRRSHKASVLQQDPGQRTRSIRHQWAAGGVVQVWYLHPAAVGFLSLLPKEEVEYLS